MEELFQAFGYTAASTSSSGSSSSSDSDSSKSSMSEHLNLDAATLFSKKGILKKALGDAHKGWTLIGYKGVEPGPEGFADTISLINQRMAELSVEPIAMIFTRRTCVPKHWGVMFG